MPGGYKRHLTVRERHTLQDTGLQHQRSLPSSMKLSATVALLMLACSCSSGSEKMCPSFHQILQNFLVGTLSSYQSVVEPFKLDKSMQEAGTRMKNLVDTLPQSTREEVLKLSVKIRSTKVCYYNSAS